MSIVERTPAPAASYLSNNFTNNFSIISCGICCVVMDSAESLSVHNMHFHPDNHRNDWAPANPSNGSAADPNHTKPIGSPTDLDNNNLTKHHEQQQIPRNTSPLNNTVSAAADSSDNQQRTSPQPANPNDHQSSSLQVAQPRSSQTFAPYENLPYANSQQQPLPPLHPNPTSADMQSAYPYLHSYDHQFYHPHGLEFAPPTAPQHPSALHQPPPQHEYKSSVPSSRFHPYMNHQNGHQITTSSSHSPRVVSSSASPSHNNPMMNQQQQQPPLGQPTPSPSPKQCDKCTYVCETNNQLNEHYIAVHSSNTIDNNSQNNNRSATTDENDMPNFQYSNQYSNPIKEEPTGDILDLDSHKMVYPPIDGSHPQLGPLPPMQSIQPVPRGMLWSPEHHAFVSSAELKGHNNPNSAYTPIKSEYSTPSKEFSPVKQPEYGLGSSTLISHMHHDSTKSFGSDVSVGNHMTTSPSEFPSTTTPQENGGPFRGTFEATSSLPNSVPVVKAGSWKSNEARRPKTYNCTACNKWFTSSGHLKRHYNTTLHKNAVKSSGQPDPATLPISVHHHPTRDQNKIGHQRGSPAQPAPSIPPEPPTSPDYASQYTPPMGFPQAQQGYQQFDSASHQPSLHPNGQAGPSKQTSQPRGLLILTTNSGTQQQATTNDQLQHHSSSSSMEMEVLHHQQDPPQIITMEEHQHQQQIQMQHHDQQQLLLDHHHQAQHQDIFMPQIISITSSSNNTSNSSTILSNSSISNTISSHQLHQLHHLPSSTISSEQDQYHPTITHSHMDTTQHINLITNPSTTITTTNHLYQVPSDLDIIQHPSEHHTQTYHTIIGNHPTTTTTIDENGQQITQLETTEANMYETYHEMMDHEEIDQENMDPTIYSISSPNMSTIYSRIHGGMAAYQHSDMSPCSPDTAEPFKILHASQIKRSSTPTSEAAFPITPSPSPPSLGIKYNPTPDTTPDQQRHQLIQHHQQTHLPPTPRSPHSPRPITQVYEVSPYGNTTLNRENNNNTSAKNKNTNSKSGAKGRSGKAGTAQNADDAASSGPHRCEECDKVFNKACYLTQHNKTFHSGEKPYKCQRCGKRFPCGASHQEHFKKHAGDKPFKCVQCPKMFNHKTDLRRHMCLHSGTKPYSCEQCGKGFIRKDHMVKHGETHRRKVASHARKMVAVQNAFLATVQAPQRSPLSPPLDEASSMVAHNGVPSMFDHPATRPALAPLDLPHVKEELILGD